MFETISQMFLHFVNTYPKTDLLSFKKGENYVSLSTQEFARRVRHLSLGLKDMGVKAGDRLIILADNSPEWVITDFANLCLGGVTVPVYTSLVPEQIRYIVDDSDAETVVCSDRRMWEKLAPVRPELGKVRRFLMMAEDAPEEATPLSRVMERGKTVDEKDSGRFEMLASAVKPGDLASIIYTSGTTGVPKGVLLSHANFVSNILSLNSIIDFNVRDTILSFLPLSHVLERMCTFAFLYAGCSIGYAESVETVADNLLELRPTIMVSVPRLFDKIYAKVIENVLTGSSLKKKIFFWALRTGKSYGRKKLAKQPIPGLLRLRRGLAARLVFSKITAKTGGRIRFFVSGGAPLAKDIAEFFYAMGLVILEGYGLTETSPVVAVNTFEDLKFGTVGKPIPGVEVKIAGDGEILVRGPNVMQGYYKIEAETREVFQDDWFMTGDIGYLDGDGFLVITDRKKDLIITAGGKNVAPQPIENMLKASPFIANPVVVGANRKFISAIIVPDFDKLEAHAREKNIPFASREELVRKPDVTALIMEEIDRCTPGLAPFEKVKKIVLLGKDFEIEAGEITPTLKVRRNIVERKYKKLIDSLYLD